MSLTSLPVSFKEIYTSNIRVFNVNPSWTIIQFVETIRPHIERDFNCHDFDIVETGQDLPGIPAEAGRPLELSNIRLKNKWGNDLRIAFYIRRHNYDYTELRNLNSINNIRQDIPNTEINPIIINSYSVTDCPICLENVLTLTRHRCSHGICNNCYYRCQQIGHTICPICRSN
jgi:hypothetical protein